MLKQQREESDPSRLGPSCQPAAQDSPTAEQVPEKPPPPRLRPWVLSPGASNPRDSPLMRALRGVSALSFIADKAVFVLPVYEGVCLPSARKIV